MRNIDYIREPLDSFWMDSGAWRVVAFGSPRPRKHIAVEQFRAADDQNALAPITLPGETERQHLVAG